MKARALSRWAAVALIGATTALTAACGSPSQSAASAAAQAATPRPATSASTTAPTTAPTTQPEATAGNGVPEASGRNVNETASVGEPTSVEIHSIGVRSNLLRLGLAPDGTAQVPSDPQRAGWFTGGARPGDEGPAVILGHIDSQTGPAVFYRLHELKPGATVTVGTATGPRVAFTVDRVEQVAKNAFPTAAVYGPAFGRQLRLITCGGTFDRSKGHYTDNIIVFATAIKQAGRP